MPYIPGLVRRADLELNQYDAKTPGELNYVLTRIVLSYLPAKPGYTAYNEVLGVLEAVKLELYRRAIAPYEDTKITENGDVGYNEL